MEQIFTARMPLLQPHEITYKLVYKSSIILENKHWGNDWHHGQLVSASIGAGSRCVMNMLDPQGQHLSPELKTPKTRNRKMAAAEVYK